MDLNILHKSDKKRSNQRCARCIAAHNWAINIVSPSFTVCNLVLVRHAVDRGHKLQVRWSGLRHIFAIHSDLVYGVTPLRGGCAERFHATRLKNYKDALLDETVFSNVLNLADR